MNDDKSNERHSVVANIMPTEWDRRCYSLATELRNALATIKDEGTSIDSGGCDGCGDLWVTVDGIEYYITIRRSNAQLVREGKLTPSDTL